MRAFISRLIDRLPEERGAILPLVTLALVVLIGMAAFATDLGWMYVNSARVQRAAEAAALSSVVELPADVAGANGVALSVAGNNGYVADLDTFVVTDPQPDGFDTRMRVEITDTIDLFFLRIFGMETQTITREATAEYLPPLPLGSPSGQFGNSCDPEQAGCSGQVNFWANIHGPDTDSRMGDAYSSRCAEGTGSGNPGCPTNPDYRPSGYLYGIEAGSGGFTVEFTDLAFHYWSAAQETGDDIRTGDRGCEDDWSLDAPGVCGPRMRVTLYGPDATPLDISDNPVVCGPITVDRQPQVVETDPYSFSSPAGCLTVGAPADGIYVLQIQITGGGQNSGLNRYSVRATGGARLYGIGDISIYNNASGTTTVFDLAQVDDIYRGKTFVVELFDPGDAGNGGTVQIKDPSGGTYPSCDMYTRPQSSSTWSFRGTQSPCQFYADNGGSGPNNFNGDWVKLEMDLPDTYSCTTCWWRVNYVFGGTPTDTTTWRAYVVGAPVHVIPNG